MKAIGTSFFGGKGQLVTVKEAAGGFNACQKLPLHPHEEPLRALAMPMETCKVRFYPMPDLKENKIRKILLSRLEGDPMVDLQEVDFGFKKVAGGVEVHFVDRSELKKFIENHDYITSSHQALYRYLKEYLALEKDLLVLAFEEEKIFCYRYFGGRLDRYAMIGRGSHEESELKLLGNAWGIECFTCLGEGIQKQLLDGREEIFLENGGLAFSIGAAIDALKPKEGIGFHTPLESAQFIQAQTKKGAAALFMGGILALSCLFFVETITRKRLETADRSLVELEKFEPFVFSGQKIPPKASAILRDLHQSIESYDLDVIEFRYSGNPLGNKPILEIEFSLEGDPKRIEMYEQSIKKASGTIFAKVERDKTRSGFVYCGKISL